MLTRKQLELLMFVHERLKESGVPPSFDEMKDALDLRSKSGIHRLIKALEERGFIKRLPNRARALEVMRLPESMQSSLAPARARGFSPSVIAGVFEEILGMFVDDGALALWSLALIVVVTVLVLLAGLPALLGAFLLLVGCLAILADSVRRACRPK